MKKYLLMAVCLIMMSMTASAITINKAMLDHNGQVTLFDGDKLQDAVNAAVDGDIIYLTLGTFKPFNVTKKITIRGTGETSVIDGDVNISIPGSAKLTSPVLEALAVSGTVNIGAQVDDMIIRKCKIADFSIGAQVDGAVLDRCYITHTFTLSSYIKGMTVVNTKLYAVKAITGASQNTTFVNCNINLIYSPNFSGTIINSIINRSVNNYGYVNSNSDGGSQISSTVLLNTLLYTYSSFVTISTSSVCQNCYNVTEHIYIENAYNVIYPSNCDCYYNTSTLQSKGYLGTDGTIVGIYGGDTPYTLEPSVPKVTSSDLKLDMEQKKLNVTLTVSPQ